MSFRNMKLFAPLVLGLGLAAGCMEGAARSEEGPALEEGPVLNEPEVDSRAHDLDAPVWSGFLGKTLHYGSCGEYCAEINKSCANTCTTSRGYPNWGAEAWTASAALTCGSVGAGQQYC